MDGSNTFYVSFQMLVPNIMHECEHNNIFNDTDVKQHQMIDLSWGQTLKAEAKTRRLTSRSRPRQELQAEAKVTYKNLVLKSVLTWTELNLYPNPCVFI